MRSSILISRISRLVETAGSSGNGSALAHDYAEAVRKANARLEAVVAAAEAKGVSDAIRLISEDPPLLEEVSTLDFFQLPDWENLCDMNGWEVPPKIDKTLTERVVEIGENKDAIAPFLAMYKKAVRVNNVRLAVKSLRRLAEIDHSQDWNGNLRQSERQLQELIVSDFRAAGSDEDRDRLAQELLDAAWNEGLVTKGADEIRSYREKREAERRAQLGAEDLAILKRCRDERWDLKLAFSMVQAIDALVEKGWQVPEEEKLILADCRARCAREFEAEEAVRRWKEVNEQLHMAIQQEDCAAIRDALSLPEFLDRDPEGDLLNQARDVLDHAEAARRRKTLQIATFSFLGVLAVLGVSGWWLRQKMFVRRCGDEAKVLAYLEKKAKEEPCRSIGLMSARLEKLKKEDPEVYADPNVGVFDGRLKSMIATNLARTNRIEAALSVLERLKESGWKEADSDGSVSGRIAQVEAELVKEDADYHSRMLSVKNDWLAYTDKIEKNNKDRAAKFQTTLVSHLGTISERLTKELARAELNKEVENCQASLEEWRKVHREFAEDLDAALTEAEKKFNSAVESQSAYKEALGKLMSASDAITALEARDNLVEYYGNYPEVKSLAPLDIGVDEVKDILDGKSVALQQFIDSMKNGISSEDFANFLDENVKIISEAPEYYSLFALMSDGDPTGKIVAVAKGKPQKSKPSYETQWKIECPGGMLTFAKREVVRELKSSKKVVEEEMPSSSEIKRIVDLANRSGLSQFQFEKELLRLIDGHIKEAHQAKYVDNEAVRVARANPYKGWMSAYRRVQLVVWYMRWLKEDLKLMPSGDMQFDRWYRRADDLSQNITIEGVDEGLAWLCIWHDRIKERNASCAKFLSELPKDFVARYQKAQADQGKKHEVAGWKVSFAGLVKFDPLDPNYVKNPNAIAPAAKGVANDHPLYVLRKVSGRATLVKAFERGKELPWRMCAEVVNNGGYKFGEPLYHVFVGGRFVDVGEELEKLFGKDGASGIPLFSAGGK